MDSGHFCDELTYEEEKQEMYIETDSAVLELLNQCKQHCVFLAPSYIWKIASSSSQSSVPCSMCESLFVTLT